MDMFERFKACCKGISESALNVFLCCPLARACIGGDLQLIDHLLELRTKFDMKHGFLPLLDRKTIHDNIVIETLIRTGQDLNQRILALSNCTLLFMYCCRYLKVELVRLLLATGRVDLAAVDSCFRTALDYLKIRI